MIIEKICHGCGKEFTFNKTYYKSNESRRKYCSECQIKRERESNHKYKHKGTCPICGESCTRGATRCWTCRERAGIKGRTCPICGKFKSFTKTWGGMCWACSIIDRKNRKVNWKGGRFKDSSGYIQVYAPEHPRVKTAQVTGRSKRLHIAEHIIIWEQSHKKPLPKTWIIHHLNGLRADNRPENLFAMNKKDHRGWTYIQNLQARIRELEQLHLPI